MAGPYNSKLRLEINERIRGEFADWFGDPVVQGKPVAKDSDYSFMGNKFQLGLRFTTEPFEAFAQFQDTLITGLPDNGVGLGSSIISIRPTPPRTAPFCGRPGPR